MSADSLLDIIYKRLVDLNDFRTLNSQLRDEERSLMKAYSALQFCTIRKINLEARAYYRNYFDRLNTMCELGEVRNFIRNELEEDLGNLFNNIMRFRIRSSTTHTLFGVALTQFSESILNSILNRELEEIKSIIDERRERINEYERTFYGSLHLFIRNFSNHLNNIKNKVEMHFASI